MQFSDFFYTHLLAKPQSLDIPKGMHFACHNTSNTRSIGACRPGHAYPGMHTRALHGIFRMNPLRIPRSRGAPPIKYINPLMTKSAETILMKKSSKHWQQHYSIGLKNNKPQVKKKVMLRKVTKVHVYVQCFSLFFQN